MEFLAFLTVVFQRNRWKHKTTPEEWLMFYGFKKLQEQIKAENKEMRNGLSVFFKTDWFPKNDQIVKD